jgi:hypothetical protein
MFHALLILAVGKANVQHDVQRLTSEGTTALDGDRVGSKGSLLYLTGVIQKRDALVPARN